MSLTKITLECVNEKLHYKSSDKSTNYKTSPQTQTKKHIKENYYDESMLASKSSGIHINHYIQLLKTIFISITFHVFYLNENDELTDILPLYKN